jgi:hypothetical protein
MKEAIHENQIPPDPAWRIFSDWQASAKEIGILFVSQSGSIATSCTLKAARNGTVILRSDSAGASFHLKGATVFYGPMQTWPRWPYPPIVEVIALQAVLPSGAWIVMAEGLRPESLSTQLLAT